MWKVLSHAKGKFSASSGPQHSSQSRTIEGLPSAVEHGEGERERERVQKPSPQCSSASSSPDCYRHLCRAFYFGRVQKSRSKSKTLGSCKNRNRKWGHAHSSSFPDTSIKFIELLNRLQIHELTNLQSLLCLTAELSCDLLKATRFQPFQIYTQMMVSALFSSTY